MPNSTDLLLTTLQDFLEVSMCRSIRSFILYARENNLSMSQMGALFHLHREGVCGVSNIGDNLGITSAAASQMVDRLVEQTLVNRTEDPDDRRAKQIVLTDKGRQVLQESIHARLSWFAELAHILTSAEQKQVGDALALLIERVGQIDDTNLESDKE